jgi:DNA adenine methylase
MARGGIFAPGAGVLRKGDGRGLLSRWYPETLVLRLNEINYLSKNITFIRGDGFEEMQRRANRARTVFFVDPPYIANGNGPGRRLYRYATLVPEDIFSTLACLSGAWLACYHNSRTIRRLAEAFQFNTRTIKMRNSHHTIKSELLISNVSLPRP